MVALMQVK